MAFSNKTNIFTIIMHEKCQTALNMRTYFSNFLMGGYSGYHNASRNSFLLKSNRCCSIGIAFNHVLATLSLAFRMCVVI